MAVIIKCMSIKLKSLNTLCAVPWMHLNFEPNGKVVPCCLTSTHNYFAGDLNEQTIEAIWNSDNMKALRRDMINGIEPAICNKCFDRERVTGESGRVHHAKGFGHVLKKIPEITEEDGTCTEMKLEYWDFRFSNICNFKCRSCGPRYSSSWVPDAKKLGWIGEQDKVWNIEGVNNNTNFDFLKEQVHNVSRIYFAGGEPLLMDEHWQILELLAANNRFDVGVSYNTNCSTLTHGGKNVIDYWSKWKPGQMEVWPSIDEIDDRAELIRSGTVWHKVESNLKELSKLDNIILRPGLTIGAMNVFRLPEIITRLVDIGVIRYSSKYNYNNFFINLLEQPIHYHVQILPDDFKKATIEKLKKFIVEYEEKYSTKIDWIFTHILHELTTPYNPEAAREFFEITQKLDLIRKENTYETIPELKVVKQALIDGLTPTPTPKIIPIFPAAEIPKPPVDDNVAKPVVYKSRKVVEIQNQGNPLILTWVTNNICTNHCSYCPENIHTGKNHHYDWMHAKSFIEKCFEKYGNVHCSISGGEPTVSPFFKDLIGEIYDRGGTIHLTTNLVRPLDYWKDIAVKFSSMAASYHPEFMTPEKEEEFIKKIKYIAQYTALSVRVMMLPSLWDQCIAFHKKLVENNDGGYSIEMVRILPNFGVGADYCTIEYTPEMELILNTTPLLSSTYTPPHSNDRPGPKHATVIYDTGRRAELDYRKATYLENNKAANFKNWTCDVGLESLFVHFDGNIQRGNCGVGGFIGNITDPERINWPTESVICPKDICHCSADLILSKRMK